ncbi:hypothetical protein Q5P01_008574 [Channa striata]|uniref:Uncharacterized protein n=1 Tax=Channa striata TaxID=64152 RepID=A0AA88N0Y7_CHASR|nr:hypothetical protein Q5P01_008574 [Channa striata]
MLKVPAMWVSSFPPASPPSSPLKLDLFAKRPAAPVVTSISRAPWEESQPLLRTGLDHHSGPSTIITKENGKLQNRSSGLKILQTPGRPSQSHGLCSCR